LAGLFALDQNFPEPIVAALGEYIVEAELTPLRQIDTQLAELDDWELLVALVHHERPWDGLITPDSGMLRQPREVAAVRQTNLTLVVAHDAGHDPTKVRDYSSRTSAGSRVRRDGTRVRSGNSLRRTAWGLIPGHSWRRSRATPTRQPMMSGAGGG
jgi:hypothetical protein